MDKWTNKFPTEEGWYWFYGYPWGKGKEDEPRLDVMRIISDSQDNLLGSMNNSFIFKHQCEGAFYKVEPPELPELKE